MEHFIVFDTETGEQKWSGNGTPGTFAALQLAPPLKAFLVTQADWNAGTASIDDMRPQIREAINTLRDSAINNGAPTPYGAVDSDPLSRSNVSGGVIAAMIAKAAEVPFSMTWTLQDNTATTLDADGMIALGMAVLSHVNAAHERCRELKALVDAAETVGNLVVLDIAAGWPTVGT